MTQKILKVGKLFAVTLPKTVLKTLGLKIGDRARVEIGAEEGAVRLLPPKQLRPADRKIAKLAHDFIDRYRKDLEALARK